jgi:hypothetical protein
MALAKIELKVTQPEARAAFSHCPENMVVFIKIL